MGALRLILCAFSGVGALLLLAACGTSESGSRISLASWSERSCAVIVSSSSLASKPDDSDSFTDQDWAADNEASEKMVAGLQAIPLPTEHSKDAERLLEILAEGVEWSKEALPKIQAASRRLRKAMETLDPASLPPAPQGQTVAGGIMAQLMQAPSIREPYEEMMRLWASVPSPDPKEWDRLTKELGLAECTKELEADPPVPPRLSAAQLAKCGERGKPVSLTRLVRVFRANGITLDMKESTCRMPLKKRASALEIAATNAGHDGLSSTEEVDRREGHVLCHVLPRSWERSPRVVKYPDEQETNASVLNIACAVYPSDAESETAQVERLRKALVALTEQQ